MALIYLAIGLVVSHYSLAIASWTSGATLVLTYAVLLLFGALTYWVLKGAFLSRLLFIAAIPVFSNLVAVLVYGPPFFFGILAEEIVGLLIGASILALALKVISATRQRTGDEA